MILHDKINRLLNGVVNMIIVLKFKLTLWYAIKKDRSIGSY